jgi:diacylglycerol kinase family enzyme
VISKAPVLVVLNPSAHGGAAGRRFDAIRSMVESSFDARIVVGRPDSEWRTQVWAALDNGVRVFFAAGGDGTAHALLNALIEAPHRPPLEDLTLGAVGLGSSNDLHKPARYRADSIPLLIDVARATPRDVVRCTYVNTAGSQEVYVLISASVGVSASANARFSDTTKSAKLLRRTSTAAAIAWATARTVATWRNIPARLCIDGGALEHVALTNLAILKTEWLSGRLRVGRSVAPDSGHFDVVLAEGLSRTRILMDIFALLRGRFDGRIGHRRCKARSLHVRLDDNVPLEFDGEVVTAHEAYFDMHTERIRLCA